MGLLTAKSPVDSSNALPFVNTGTPYDMFTGQYVRGHDGKRYLMGGLSSANAVQSGPNKGKSTLLHTVNTNAMMRYEGSDYYIADSEDALRDRARLCRMIQYDFKSSEERMETLNRYEDENIKVFNTTHEHGQSVDHFLDYMEYLGKLKLENRKDFEIETPYIDKKTGKPQRILLPTFAAMDSFSELDPAGMVAKALSRTADTPDKDTRTDGAEEGRMKKALITRMIRLSMNYGIYFSLSAHLNNKMSLDGKPQPKDLPHMRQGQTATGVSRQFYYYMTTIGQIDGTKNIPDIPLGVQSSETELLEMDITLVRSKNGNSGNRMLFTSSQQFGVQTGLGWYNYLRSNGYFGMNNSSKPNTVFQPGLMLFKNRAFDLCRDYQTGRALEILGQLCFIQKNWTLVEPEVDYLISPEKLVEELNKTTYAVDDILNSRGWWGTTPTDREYLGLPDIIDIATGNYTPKLVAVSSKGKK